QPQPASVEARGIELCGELLNHALGVQGEDVLKHPDLTVVMEGHVEVVGADEVDRDTGAGRATNSQADLLPAPGRRQDDEGGREHGARALLSEAEEAPRPLAGLDAAGCDVRGVRG